MTALARCEYPQLDLILWDIHTDNIDPEIAFKIYEQRWAFVDTTVLTINEKQLITELAEMYGNGVFMPRH